MAQWSGWWSRRRGRRHYNRWCSRRGRRLHTEAAGTARTKDLPGAAYVFSKSGRAWLLEIKLTAPLSDQRFGFGSSISVDDGTLVIGADSGRTAFSDRPGTVYVFTRPDDGWSSISSLARLTAPDATNGDFFGETVSVSGDTVIVGSSSGAFVFTRPSGGWTDTSAGTKVRCTGSCRGIPQGCMARRHSLRLRRSRISIHKEGKRR